MAETLEGSNFDVKPSIPVLMGPGCGLVVASAEPPQFSEFDGGSSLLDLVMAPHSSSLQPPEFGDGSSILSLTASRVVAVCHSFVLFPSVLVQFFGLLNFCPLRLLLDLDTYGGVDSVSAFPLFLTKVAAIFAPKLSIIFHMLMRLESFPECLKSEK